MRPITTEFYQPSPLCHELQILSILARNAGVSQKQIAFEVGVVPSMVHNYLHRLAAKGLIEFQGPSRRRTRYVLTKVGEDHLRGLSGRYAEEACRTLEQIAGWIRSELARAARDGIRRLGVLNCPALAETLVRLGRESGLEIRALDREGQAGAGIPADSLADLDAVLVAADPAREEIRKAITAAGERGLPVYRLG